VIADSDATSPNDNVKIQLLLLLTSNNNHTPYVKRFTFYAMLLRVLNAFNGWLCGTVVERRSATGELSLSYGRPAADG